MNKQTRFTSDKFSVHLCVYYSSWNSKYCSNQMHERYFSRIETKDHQPEEFESNIGAIQLTGFSVSSFCSSSYKLCQCFCEKKILNNQQYFMKFSQNINEKYANRIVNHYNISTSLITDKLRKDIPFCCCSYYSI